MRTHRVGYLKKQDKTGAVIFTRKLAAIVSPPHHSLTTFYGVFALSARLGYWLNFLNSKVNLNCQFFLQLKERTMRKSLNQLILIGCYLWPALCLR